MTLWTDVVNRPRTSYTHWHHRSKLDTCFYVPFEVCRLLRSATKLSQIRCSGRAIKQGCPVLSACRPIVLRFLGSCQFMQAKREPVPQMRSLRLSPTSFTFYYSVSSGCSRRAPFLLKYLSPVSKIESSEGSWKFCVYRARQSQHQSEVSEDCVWREWDSFRISLSIASRTK